MRDVIDRLPRSYPLLEARLNAFDADLKRHRLVFRRKLESLQRQAADEFTAEGVAAATQWLASGGNLPTNKVAENLIFPYVEAVANSQDKVWSQLSIVIKDLRDGDHDSLIDDLMTSYARLGGSINAHLILQPPINFWGSRIHVTGKETRSTTIAIYVKDVVGLNFAGRYERDGRYKGRPKYEISGSVRGCRFTARIGKYLEGRNEKDWEFNGYVIGDTIIGRYIGKGASNRNETGPFIMRRQK